MEGMWPGWSLGGIPRVNPVQPLTAGAILHPHEHVVPTTLEDEARGLCSEPEQCAPVREHPSGSKGRCCDGPAPHLAYSTLTAPEVE